MQPVDDNEKPTTVAVDPKQVTVSKDELAYYRQILGNTVISVRVVDVVAVKLLIEQLLLRLLKEGPKTCSHTTDHNLEVLASIDYLLEGASNIANVAERYVVQAHLGKIANEKQREDFLSKFITVATHILTRELQGRCADHETQLQRAIRRMEEIKAEGEYGVLSDENLQ